MGRFAAYRERPLRTGRAADSSNGYVASLNHTASSRRTATLLCAMWVTSIGCFGPPTRLHRSPRLPNEPTLDTQNGLTAPLELEGRPAFVIVRQEGSCPEGFQHRIEFSLGSRKGTRFLRVCAEAPGLLIFPRDLIGSEDSDPVVTTQPSCISIYNQMNDGYGGFGFSHLDARSWSPRIRSTPISPQHKQETFRLTARRTHRSVVDFTAGSRFFGMTILGRPPPTFLAELQESCRTNPQTRAPPRPFLQQLS
jgi:hypothetical protein